MMAKIYFLILSFILLNSIAQCELSLRTLFIIHRHGNRAPTRTFANDFYKNDSNYLNGFGQLTNEGKFKMYDVGQYLRMRYQNFLTDNIHEVYVRSSGKERCIESTELLVNGAYKPMGNFIWKKDANFLPVPVQSLPFVDDLVSNYN